MPQFGSNADVILTNRKLLDNFKVWTVDKTGKQSDDNAWSNRALLALFYDYRARIISEELKKNPNSYRFARQTIPCIPIEKADKNECPCAPASGCSWKKTKFKLPKPIGQGLITANSIDGSIKYSYVDWDSVKYKFSSRIPADRNRPYYTIKNGYLYLHNDIHKKFISVTATWADPLIVQAYPNCKGELDPCVKKLDFEIPTDPSHLPLIYEATFNALTNYRGRADVDIINNDQIDRPDLHNQ